MDKPIKPNVDLPDSFGGVKNNFSTSKILNGYEKDVPDIFGGANINYMLDTLGKRQTYYDTLADYINALPIGKTITTDNNNKLTYADLRTDFSGLANIDLSNLTATGENHFANKDLSNLTYTGETHFLNKTQISNCILEAPNGYLTYSGNALTLKQGLKFFVPRGRLVDGRLNNYECVLSGDVTGYAPPWNGTTTRYEIFVDINANVVMTWSQEAYYIDEDAPILTSGQTAIWYNLVDNYFAYFDLATNQWVTVDYAHIGSYEVLPNTDTIRLVKPRYPMRVLSNADQNLIAQCAFPSENSTFLTLGASGTKYKALSAGWFAFDVVGGAVGEYALLKVYHQGATLPIYTLQQSVFAAGAHVSWLVPVNHGDILEATYTLTGGVYYFGFIYAEGEV